jgi:hypothetical protein
MITGVNVKRDIETASTYCADATTPPQAFS